MTEGLRLRQIVFACESETSFDTCNTFWALGRPFMMISARSAL
jgi:hypothetical protein